MNFSCTDKFGQFINCFFRWIPWTSYVQSIGVLFPGRKNSRTGLGERRVVLVEINYFLTLLPWKNTKKLIFFTHLFDRCLCQISNQFINFLQAFFLCCAFIVIITIYSLIGKINFLSYSQMFIFSYLPRFKSMYWLCIHKTFSHKKCIPVCITNINTIVIISNFLFSLLFCDNISCKNHY